MLPSTVPRCDRDPQAPRSLSGGAAAGPCPAWCPPARATHPGHGPPRQDRAGQGSCPMQTPPRATHPAGPHRIPLLPAAVPSTAISVSFLRNPPAGEFLSERLQKPAFLLFFFFFFSPPPLLLAFRQPGKLALPSARIPNPCRAAARPSTTRFGRSRGAAGPGGAGKRREAGQERERGRGKTPRACVCFQRDNFSSAICQGNSQPGSRRAGGGAALGGHGAATQILVGWGLSAREKHGMCLLEAEAAHRAPGSCLPGGGREGGEVVAACRAPAAGKGEMGFPRPPRTSPG